MELKIKKTGVVTHQLAQFLYWCSLLLLLAGMWVLIDPFHRIVGQTLHVYITLTAFELYIWLLLILAGWQVQKGLITDAVRSGIFIVALVGVLFITLNELYMASAREAYGISILAILLTAAKLLAAKRWLSLRLPGPLLASCFLWVIFLALPAPILHLFLDSKSNQHVAAYLICWGAAFLTAGHLPLVAWQKHKGFNGDNTLLKQWWIGWLLPVLLAVLVVLQLYATMWGLFVDWAQWYFSPILLAAAVVSVSLHSACQKRRLEAWLIMCIFVAHAAVVWVDPIPREFPMAWRQGAAAYATHPIYPSGIFVSVLLAGAGLLLQRWWLFAMAGMTPLTAGAYQAAEAVWQWRHGKGLALMIGAFVLLAVGAALQWWQERWGALRHGPKPSLETDNKNDKGFGPDDLPETPTAE